MAGSPGAGERPPPRAPPAGPPGGGGSPRVPLRERSREDLLRLVGEGARRVKVLQGRLEEAERAREGAEAGRGPRAPTRRGRRSCRRPGTRPSKRGR